MTLSEMIMLAVALGMDAFSVALGVGFVATEKRQVFRLCWHFGLFQFLMPLLGWQAARLLSPRIGAVSVWLGAGLLFVIGTRMIWEGRKGHGEEGRNVNLDPTKGWSLVGLSVATSIDALGVGFGVGLVETNLLKACVVIGITAMVMTWLGMYLGRMVGRWTGPLAEMLGGGVLILLGIRLLVS